MFRFWEGTVAGTYVGHGETYLDPQDILWWSKGGTLRGQSPARIAFLRKVLEEGPAEGVEPIDKWEEPHFGGQPAQYYLLYFGKEATNSWTFNLPKPALEDGMKFKVEVLDTWNMTVTPVKGLFTVQKKSDYSFGDSAGRSIGLPSRPYIALRIRRV